MAASGYRAGTPRLPPMPMRDMPFTDMASG
jgi:hypothetical protein